MARQIYRISWVVCGLLVLVVVAMLVVARTVGSLPYGASNPVIYDNDSATDNYTDVYLLALASNREIQLKGLITSVPADTGDLKGNPFIISGGWKRMFNERQDLLAAAKKSGFIVPTHLPGPQSQLQKPASGRIKDTKPIGSEGSRFIVAEARKATAEKPLVIVVGGPLTAEADAYLLDPSIADRMIVAWIGGHMEDMGGYNGWQDGWAAYITLQKLRTVVFPESLLWLGPSNKAPYVPKSQLLELPSSPLRDFMYHRVYLSTVPGDHDWDAPPAISLMRADYFKRLRRVSFKDWRVLAIDTPRGSAPHEIPTFRVHPLGRVLVVKNADQNVATTEWWRAIRKASAL